MCVAEPSAVTYIYAFITPKNIWVKNSQFTEFV